MSNLPDFGAPKPGRRSKVVEVRARRRGAEFVSWGSLPPPARIQHSDAVLGSGWQFGRGAFAQLAGHFPIESHIESRFLRDQSALTCRLRRNPLRIRTCNISVLRTVSSWYRTRPLPIDPFPVRRPPKPSRVFFTRRTFAHAFSQKHTTLIPRTSPPASLPRRDMSNPGQLSSR